VTVNHYHDDNAFRGASVHAGSDRQSAWGSSCFGSRSCAATYASNCSLTSDSESSP
jgi:hypothetical protein